MKIAFAFLLSIICVANATYVSAGNYSDPTGYSVTYPDGWTAIPGAGSKIKTTDLPPETQKWLQNNKSFDMSKVSLVIMHKIEEDYTSNVAVTMYEADELPVSDSAAQSVLKGAKTAASSQGISMTESKASVRTFGANKGIYTEYTMLIPSLGYKTRHHQFSLPGGGKTYIFVCSAKESKFDEESGAFQSMLASISVPAPIKAVNNSAYESGRTFGRLLVPAIVVAVLVMIFRKRS